MSDFDSVMAETIEELKEAAKEVSALKAERDKYRAIALRLIRVYRVDDQAWAPDEEAKKMLDKEAEKMLDKEAGS